MKTKGCPTQVKYPGEPMSVYEGAVGISSGDSLLKLTN